MTLHCVKILCSEWCLSKIGTTDCTSWLVTQRIFLLKSNLKLKWYKLSAHQFEYHVFNHHKLLHNSKKAVNACAKVMENGYCIYNSYFYHIIMERNLEGLGETVPLINILVHHDTNDHNPHGIYHQLCHNDMYWGKVGIRKTLSSKM